MANLGGEQFIRAPANVLPPNLARHIRGAHPRRMALRDRNNNVWYMDIEKHGDNWYFTKGWREFAETNMIKKRDVINYGYVSRNLLDVEILSFSRDPNGEVVYESKNIKKGVESEDVVAEVVAVESEHEKTADDEAGLVDDGSEDVEAVVADEANDGAGTSDAVQRRKRRKTIDINGLDLIVSGRIRRPAHPYFVTEMRNTRVNELYIPREIIKYHGAELPDHMMIVDSQGNFYPTMCKRWRDGRIVYYGGWNSVCKVNLAQEGDKIVCEFVPSNNGSLQLNVTFLPATDRRQL